MKRLEIKNDVSPNFIGNWDLENKELCKEIIDFFENNSDLHTKGTTGGGVDESIKKDKKEKPISSEKLINKILKKIQNKEDQITDLTSELEKTNFSSKQESNYNYLVNELKKAQFELNSLEKEWIDIEERMISDD